MTTNNDQIEKAPLPNGMEDMSGGVSTHVETQEPAKPDPRPEDFDTGSDADDMREAIADKYDRRRAGDAADIDREDEANVRSFGKAVLAAQDEEQVNTAGLDAHEAQDAREAAADEQIVTLKINGETRQMKLSEALAHAQKSVAADDVLDKAKGELSEARALRQELEELRNQTRAPATTPAATNADGAKKPQAHAEHQGDAIRDIVEKIQFGDTEEAAEALTQFAASVAQASTTEAQRQQAEGSIRAREQQSLASFIQQHAVYQDNEAGNMLAGHLFTEAKDNLASIGVPKEYLDSLTTGDQVMSYRRKLMMTPGWAEKVTPAEKLLESAHSRVSRIAQRFGAPVSPQQPTQQQRPTGLTVTADRSERKAAIIPQPKGNTGIQGRTTPGAPVTQADHRRAAFAEMQGRTEGQAVRR